MIRYRKVKEFFVGDKVRYCNAEYNNLYGQWSEVIEVVKTLVYTRFQNNIGFSGGQTKHRTNRRY